MKTKKKINRWILFVVLCIFFVIVYLPIFTIILNSFRSEEDILSKGFLESAYTLATYKRLLQNPEFVGYLKNSLIISLVSTLANIFVSTFAGYALSRFKNKLVNRYSSLLLLLQMFPLILCAVPLFIVFRTFHLVNSYISIILLYTATSLPFTTWMFRGYFDEIPEEVEQAAWIDGCGRLDSFRRIVLPLSGPGMASVSIYAFLQGWNEFFLANIFLMDNAKRTLPVGISMFINQFSKSYGRLSCAACLAMIPTFIFFLVGQKYIVGGALAGSVKG